MWLQCAERIGIAMRRNESCERSLVSEMKGWESGERGAYGILEVEAERAGLDVFVIEPLPRESPLRTLDNVIITPHNSSTGTGNYRRGVEIFLRNLEAYLRGEAVLENEVGGGSA